MPEKASISQVYKEVKTIRRILEELSEKGILQSLAEESITEEEKRELDKSLEEVKQGKFVPLRKQKRG
jgi:ribosomal protein S19E (S16A)